MSAPEVTYGFYHDEWGGQLDEGGFLAALPHALAEVRRLTWPNDPVARGAEAAWSRAVCAAVDVDAAYGSTGGAGASNLSSVTTGTVSMGFGGGGGASAYDADMARAVSGELVGTGMLFMGLG